MPLLTTDNSMIVQIHPLFTETKSHPKKTNNTNHVRLKPQNTETTCKPKWSNNRIVVVKIPVFCADPRSLLGDGTARESYLFLEATRHAVLHRSGGGLVIPPPSGGFPGNSGRDMKPLERVSHRRGSGSPFLCPHSFCAWNPSTYFNFIANIIVSDNSSSVHPPRIISRTLNSLFENKQFNIRPSAVSRILLQFAHKERV